MAPSRGAACTNGRTTGRNEREQALVEQLRQQQLELARAPVPLEVAPAPAAAAAPAAAPAPEAAVGETTTAVEAEEAAAAPEAVAPPAVAAEGGEAPAGGEAGLTVAEAEVPETGAAEVAGSEKDSEESRRRRESIKNNAEQVLKVQTRQRFKPDHRGEDLGISSWQLPQGRILCLYCLDLLAFGHQRSP